MIGFFGDDLAKIGTCIGDVGRAQNKLAAVRSGPHAASRCTDNLQMCATNDDQLKVLVLRVDAGFAYPITNARRQLRWVLPSNKRPKSKVSTGGTNWLTAVVYRLT